MCFIALPSPNFMESRKVSWIWIKSLFEICHSRTIVTLCRNEPQTNANTFWSIWGRWDNWIILFFKIYLVINIKSNFTENVVYFHYFIIEYKSRSHRVLNLHRQETRPYLNHFWPNQAHTFGLPGLPVTAYVRFKTVPLFALECYKFPLL